MSTVQLSMPIGLQLEIARSGGLSNDCILEICKSKDFHALKSLNQDDEDWEMLFQFAEEHWEEFKEAVQAGYKFKFVTRNGLKHFMIHRYGLEEGKDFEFGDTYFDQVKLKPNQVVELEGMITQNWRIKRLTTENNGRQLIRIELSR
ncbi:hypothetical protein H5P36_02905 [Bacillus sp. APMAM]|nr:hypothetical protein [Bacillus sp. APMAM]RTZ57053.1 hypothetical protein EKO25_03835 [Bacillus sp. SAJ1]